MTMSPEPANLYFRDAIKRAEQDKDTSTSITEQVDSTCKVYQHPGSNAEWPTLASLTSQGKQLILLQHNHVNICPGGNGWTPKINDQFDYIQGSSWDYDMSAILKRE